MKTATATFIKGGLLRGNANLYKTEEGYIIVSRADTDDRGDETMAFTADENGEVKSWNEIGVGYGITHEQLLEEMGYTFVLQTLEDYLKS